MEDNKTINILSEQYKQNLTKLINNSGLPISNIYFITKLTLQQLQNLYYGTLNSEMAKSEEKQIEQMKNGKSEQNQEQI